jgi:hypothetical protein
MTKKKHRVWIRYKTSKKGGQHYNVSRKNFAYTRPKDKFCFRCGKPSYGYLCDECRKAKGRKKIIPFIKIRNESSLKITAGGKSAIEFLKEQREKLIEKEEKQKAAAKKKKEYDQQFFKTKRLTDPGWAAKRDAKTRAWEKTPIGIEKVKEREKRRYLKDVETGKQKEREKVSYAARKADPEQWRRAIERATKWRKEHPERYLAATRARYKLKKEEISRQKRERRATDPEWRAKNLEYQKKRYQMRKAAKEAAKDEVDKFLEQ